MAGIVLIAIDASDQAEAAFQWYLEHIHSHGNTIVILHCVDLSAINAADDQATSEATFTHMWHVQKNKIKALEDKYRWMLNEHGICGKIRTESGKPGDVIIRAAKEEHAKLIVIGSRCLSKLKRTLAGSVSDHVLHNATCPVIICHHVQKDKDNSTQKPAEQVKRVSFSTPYTELNSPKPESPNKHAPQKL